MSKTNPSKKYNNPVPVVIGLLRSSKSNAFLGIVRGDNNGIAFPGGYIDERENAETAIAREIQEEIGIVTEVSKWVPVETFITPHNLLLIFMHYDGLIDLDNIADDFKPNREVKSITKISTGQNIQMVYPVHQRFLDGELAKNLLDYTIIKEEKDFQTIFGVAEDIYSKLSEEDKGIFIYLKNNTLHLRNIRNQYKLWDYESIVKANFAYTYKLFGHADDLSQIIYDIVVCKIQNKSENEIHSHVNKLVEELIEHWKNMGIYPLTGEKY